MAESYPQVARFCFTSRESSAPMWGRLPLFNPLVGRLLMLSVVLGCSPAHRCKMRYPRSILSGIKVGGWSPSALLLCFKFSNWFRTWMEGKGLSCPLPTSPNIWWVGSWTWHLGSKMTPGGCCFWQMLYQVWATGVYPAIYSKLFCARVGFYGRAIASWVIW